MKYIVINETQGCIYKFIINGINKRIFKTREQARRLCKQLNRSFPTSKYRVVRCKTLSDCKYPILM